MDEDTINRASAIRIISNYRDELVADKYKESTESLAARVYACEELIFLIKTFDDPPLEIIENFGRKMKAYSQAYRYFSDAVLACEVICALLGG